MIIAPRTLGGPGCFDPTYAAFLIDFVSLDSSIR